MNILIKICKRWEIEMLGIDDDRVECRYMVFLVNINFF